MPVFFLPEGARAILCVVDRSVAAALVAFALLCSAHVVRTLDVMFHEYPHVRVQADEAQTTAEAVLYLHAGRGHSSNYVYGGGFPSVLAGLLSRARPGRLSLEQTLALAKETPAVFYVWGRLVSLVWSLILLATVYLASRTVAPPAAAVAVIALAIAVPEFALRSSASLVDVQASALVALSVLALRCDAARSGACALGAAVSTKYNAATLALAWVVHHLLGPSAPGVRRLALFTVVAAAAFFAVSPQFGLHPLAAVEAIRGEAQHQSSTWLLHPPGPPFAWFLVESARPANLAILLARAAALASLRAAPDRPDLRPLAIGYLAGALLVAASRQQRLYYVLPILPAGLVCVAAQAARGRGRALALALAAAAAVAVLAGDLAGRRPGDTRAQARAYLVARVPAGTRTLLLAPWDADPGLPPHLCALQAYAPLEQGGALLTAAELAALHADVLVVSPYWVHRLYPDLALPPPEFRTALELHPDADHVGPDLQILTRNVAR